VTAREALAQAVERLRLAGVEDAPLEARILLEYALGMTRARLLARPLLPLATAAQASYAALIDRRARREPLPYVLGRQPFRRLDLLVDRRALIPRPETELLVELALGYLTPLPPSHPFGGLRRVGKGERIAADVGTGSGAIAISLAVEAPLLRVLATDLSSDALALARENARRHDVADRVTFLLGDLLDPLSEPVDLIVANLPYVPTAEAASQPELSWEPRLALDGGPDGLDAYRRFLEQTPEALRPGGCLLFEIGAGQGGAALALASRAFPGAGVRLHGDYAGRDRVVEVRLAEAR